MYTVPSRSFHQTGALAQVPTLSGRRRSQSVFSMSASFQSSSVVAQMFSSHASLLQLDQAGVIDIVTSLDGDVHHGPMLAATTTRDKPKTCPQIHAIGHATGTTSERAS
jgi:hypothetical protein